MQPDHAARVLSPSGREDCPEARNARSACCSEKVVGLIASVWDEMNALETLLVVTVADRVDHSCRDDDCQHLR